MATLFALGMPKFLKFYKALGIQVKVERKIKVKSRILDGHIIAFTGFRSKDLEQLIIQNGGQAKDSIGRDTTILLVKQKGSGSSKEKLALQRGIKVMTPQEFVKKYGLTF